MKNEKYGVLALDGYFNRTDPFSGDLLEEQYKRLRSMIKRPRITFFGVRFRFGFLVQRLQRSIYT
jgi:hypothetical protein